MNELTSFLIGIGVLILYLIFSAFTEMGTKNPWKKNDTEKTSADHQTPSER